MSWRALMKTGTHRQNRQNGQNHPKRSNSVNSVNIVNRNENEKQPQDKPIKALGYGCSKCGNRIYEAVEAWVINEMPESYPWTHEHKPVIHWQCEGCGAVFEIIGGSRGPQAIN